MKRYIPGIPDAWHFLASPVTGQDIDENKGNSESWLPSGSYGNGTGYDLYLWNESNSSWIYKLDSISAVNWNTVHPGRNFTAGRGYLYSVEATNPTKTFVGNLNNGPVSYMLTSIGTVDSLKGFNLLGNPYPSAIDWQAGSGWSRSNLMNSGGGFDMWIWNPAANNYGVCNSSSGSIGTNGITRYIAPMQGYFVRASGAGSLVSDNPVRVLEDAFWLKKAPQQDRQISLRVHSDGGYGADEIQVNFGYAANENGAMKLFSAVSTAPSLFLSNLSENLSVRYFTNTADNPVVPFRFIPGIDGNYTISCDFNMSQFDTIVLEDRQLHSSQNMKAIQSYSFHASKTDPANRFYLRFGTDKNHSDNTFPARIYADGTHLVFDLIFIPEETEVYVYDLLGQLLLRKKLAGEIQHRLPFSAPAQLLVVYLKNSNGTMCRKLFWIGV
ncbi:MAG: hypothetical protein NTW16_13950 [Bacteroidetes bacterium]|nr:hypothetical protein [Bacteroidota bacterium]